MGKAIAILAVLAFLALWSVLVLGVVLLFCRDYDPPTTSEATRAFYPENH